MAKVRLTIELEIDEEACEEYGVTPSDIVEELDLCSSDVIDGYELFAYHPDLDISSDFVLGDACVVSKELV